MKKTLTAVIAEILKKKGNKLTPQELASLIVKTGQEFVASQKKANKRENKPTLTVIVADILKKKGKKLTARELADIIAETEHEFVANKTKKTGKTEKVLVFQLMSEIGAQYYKLQMLGVHKTEDRPAKYWYKAPAASKAAKGKAASSPKTAK